MTLDFFELEGAVYQVVLANFEGRANRDEVAESQEDLGSLVVTYGNIASVLELVEAPLDKVAQPIKGWDQRPCEAFRRFIAK